MAKDGTLRGGARIGAGRKKKSISENKITFENSSVPILTLPTAELHGADIPDPKEYLSAEQKKNDNKKTYAVQIYRETYQWLKACQCENLVPQQQVENFAQIMARQIQCEQAIDEFGFLSKHPTTGAPIQSPFVKMSLDYMRQATNLWLQIYSVVKQNFAKAYKTGTANETMEKILSNIRRVK